MSHLLARHSTFVGYARVRGKLYDLGDYPGVVPSSEDHRWVRGEVYELDEGVDVLATLDRYEGCHSGDPEPHEFERVTGDATFEDGKTVQVWIYVYKMRVDEKPEITSGDYFHNAL